MDEKVLEILLKNMIDPKVVCGSFNFTTSWGDEVWFHNVTVEELQILKEYFERNNNE